MKKGSLAYRQFMQTRNVAIVRAVLGGEPCVDVAPRYGLTPGRIQVIVHEHCRRQNSELYWTPRWQTLRFLREHRAAFGVPPVVENPLDTEP